MLYKILNKKKIHSLLLIMFRRIYNHTIKIKQLKTKR
jgi:hypothetical protein